MPARPRNNRTADGMKKRWTPEDRAARSGSAPDRAARRPAGEDNRAGRRGDRFGEAASAPRDDRRTDWYPGPRNGKRPDASSRFRRDDRPATGQDDRRTRRDDGDRGRRDDTRPVRADAPAGSARDQQGRRPFRADAPKRPFRDDDRRPARTGDPRSSFRGDETRRAPRADAPRGAFRRDEAERAPRRDESRGSFRDDAQRRPSRDDEARAPRDTAPRRGSRDDAPRASFRSADDRRPFRGDDRRPTRDDRPSRPSRDEAPRRAGDRGPRREWDTAHNRAPQREPRGPVRDVHATKWAPAEDVVLERLQGEVVTAEDVAGSSFADLGLGQQITRALEQLGATAPFPIQAATIPDVLAGRNVLGRGRTGSGKTIAFGAGLVERLMRNWAESGRTGTGRRTGRPPRALILAPTRELALQIDRTVQPIARAVGLYTTQIVGGVPQARQVGALAKGVDIVIGTPGRIEDLLEQRRLDLSDVEIAVLDEADHMAELGFLEPIQRLLRQVPRRGQRLLFSATLDVAVSKLVGEFLPEPAVHEVAEAEGAVTADHRVLVIEQGEKLAVLTALLASVERSLVFARTRAFAEQLADELDGEGVRAESLHGDLNQARRTRNLAKFSEGRVAALVATDVAARGIHVDDIELVVHADSAEDYKTYLHRSGRTGRAGASGTVVTLITARRRRSFTELLQRAGVEADFVVLPAGADPVAAIGR